MGRELGRISGPLLADNLLRNGVDLAFETDLLYLDVINGRIGVRTESPSQTLTVNSTVHSPILRVDQQAAVGDFTISTNNIQYVLGAMYIRPDQSTDPKILTTKLATANIEVSNQLIKNKTINSDLNFTAAGTGVVTFNTTQVNVNGNLHATGDITWDGTITFGNSNTDNVTFNSDIASDLVPNVDNRNTLGTATKRWGTVYAVNLDTTTIEASGLVSNGIDLVYSPANTLFVSINGDDTNIGTHQHATFRTIKHALSVATAGDTVYVYPGTYHELFPLTVPTGVTVTGVSLRGVTVEPKDSTLDKDAFLLNGETTIENITVQNFFYNSIDNTGYAFRFAPGAKVTTRSPYVRNVTVITHGYSEITSYDGEMANTIYSTILDGGFAGEISFDQVFASSGAHLSLTDPLDPLGFADGNAGKGAYIDGSVCDPTTYEAAMLFHAVTMITPGVDAITALNGTRVEWLNSFTYFANRGIFLQRGTAGLGSEATVYGAELRSINSANVYGNYGAVADGLGTLAYLIGHNFAYIGVGKDLTNDPKNVIQAHEVIQTNDGVIYWESVDHHGDFRIGDIFYVQQSTGLVSFNAQSFNLGSAGSLYLNSPSSSTYIDKNGVQTGNIWLHGNTVESLLGPVNLLASSGNTYLNTDVFVTGSVNITADVNVDGNIFLGNESTDTITIAPYLTQDIVPDATNTLTLGTSSKRWNILFNKLIDVDSVTQLTNNTITTLTGNTDLQFTAAGTGLIKVTSSDVSFEQDLSVGGTFTVDGNTSLKDTEVFGNVGLSGNINQTGDTYITGTFNTSTAKITGTSYLQGHYVRILGNEVSITQTDTDLSFSANGTGGVILDQKLKITNNEISNVWASPTADAQRSIDFTPNGTGNVKINSTKAAVFPLSNNSIRALSTLGEVRYNTNTNLFEGYLTGGRVSFNNVWDSDRNTYITAELTPGANDNTMRFGINGAVKATLDSTKLYSNSNHFGNISIVGNTISNLTSSSDIIITTPGDASFIVNDIYFANSSITNSLDSALILQNTGNGYVRFTGTGAMVIPYGPTEDRRTNPEVGELRNNSTIGYMEVFNGTDWIPAIGTSGAATLEDVELAMDIWSLVLG